MPEQNPPGHLLSQTWLARSEITKGYEYEKGKYITIEQEDLEKIKLESTRTIKLIQFVNQSELDPVYIDAAYYVAPEVLWPRKRSASSIRLCTYDL